MMNFTNNPNNESQNSEVNRIDSITEGELISFSGYNNSRRVIKVVGIGGGGGNALNHMFKEGVDNVSYLALNTDAQDLNKLEIPDRLVIGPSVTQGLGAGDDPERARLAAEESAADIRKMLDDGETKIVFITAGMGGGTGTGASPIVARIAKKELGLLTVGIVTIPFLREGERKILKALKAVERLRDEVDAILIINNEKILELYPREPYSHALYLADLTLVNAARSVSDLIYKQGEINVDTNDVVKTLRNGGVAVISSGEGEGENRLKEAIDKAVHSPLLNGNDVYRASRLLVFFYMSREHELRIDEMAPLDALSASMDRSFEYIQGHAFDDSLGEKVKFTILASGFDLSATEHSIRQGNMEDRLTMQERANREEQDRELLNRYYEGKDGQLLGSIGQSRPFILFDEELDDERIIKILDSTPAALRRHDELEVIRSEYAFSKVKPSFMRKQTHPKEEDGAKDQNKGEGSRLITF